MAISREITTSYIKNIIIEYNKQNVRIDNLVPGQPTTHIINCRFPAFCVDKKRNVIFVQPRTLSFFFICCYIFANIHHDMKMGLNIFLMFLFYLQSSLFLSLMAVCRKYSQFFYVDISIYICIGVRFKLQWHICAAAPTTHKCTYFCIFFLHFDNVCIQKFAQKQYNKICTGNDF